MENVTALLGFTPDQMNLLVAGLVAGLVVKGLDLLLILLTKLAKRTKTTVDDALVEAIATAVHAKVKK